MTERNSLMQEVGAALRDQGITAAITALISGTIALLAAVSRRAFTNDAMLARLGTSSRLWESDQKKPVVNSNPLATSNPSVPIDYRLAKTLIDFSQSHPKGSLAKKPEPGYF